MNNITITNQITNNVVSSGIHLEKIPYILLNSVAKAVLIDAPVTLLWSGGNLPATLLATVAGTTSYLIRGIARDCLDMPLEGGLIGGAVKYAITGGNPIIGALNNLAYEIISDAKLDDTPIASTTAAIVVESIDTVLSKGLVPGAAYGPLIGASVGVIANVLYAPVAGVIKELTTLESDVYNLVTTDSSLIIGETIALDTCLAM